jgi:hypothetical protein
VGPEPPAGIFAESKVGRGAWRGKFADVRGKFFTEWLRCENKVATTTARRNIAMLTELKAILARSSSHLLEDLLGCAALLVALVAALHLPGPV